MTAEKKASIYAYLKKTADILPALGLLSVLLVFSWGPVKSAADIASKSQQDSLSRRVADLEIGRVSLEQDVALLNVGVAELSGKISKGEVEYWNAQILRGVWDKAALQKRLYGVAGIVP